MRRDQHLRIYDLHSWTGIALGMLVFAVSFSGCLALFHHELKTWEDPARRIVLNEQRAPIHERLSDWVKQTAAGRTITYLQLDYPGELTPYYQARLFLQDANGTASQTEQRWHPATGEALAPRGHGLSSWLYDFHRDWMWPKALGGHTMGRSLVGLIGIVLMLSILSGIVIHRKLLRELFTLRFNRQVRLKWQDSHKVLGTWGLPFYIIVSFTGAYLGIIALLLPVIGTIVVQGDTAKLVEVIGAGQTPATGTAAAMLSVDDMYQRRHPESGLPPGHLFIYNWNDQAGIYQLAYPADTELMPYEITPYSAVTGEPVAGNLFLERTFTNRVFEAIASLHYATYGGVSLKFLYLALGLSLCVITALGNMMWLERRLYGREGRQSTRFYQRLNKLTLGFCYGMVIASIALFYHDKLYSGMEENRLFWTGCSYFLVWLAVLIYAQLKTDDYLSNRQLMAAAACLLIGIPVINGVTTADYFWRSLFHGHTITAWVDVSALAIGLLALVIAKRLPTARSSQLPGKPENDPSFNTGEYA